MRKILMILMTVILVSAMLLPQTAGANESVDTPTWYNKLKYVALGDSLAIGVNEQNKFGKSYTDFIAEELRAYHLLASFSKGYAFPGYTTTDVLTQMKANALRLADVGIQEDGLPERTLDAVTEADFITISAGANDLLRHVRMTDTGIIIDTANRDATFAQIAKNYEDIFATIYEVNPDAHVYVMGYYNAFAHVSEQYEAQAQQLLAQLNQTIATVAQAQNAVFIETAAAIDSDIDRYLPNPTNIHVSEAGYEVIAHQFLQYMSVLKQQTPSRLHVEALSTTSMQLTWDAPLFAEKVSHYSIYLNEQWYADVAATERQLTINDLTPGHVYNVEIRLVDMDGQHEVNLGLASWELLWSEPSQYVFTDIVAHPDAAYMDRAFRLEFVDGYADQTFRPHQNLTRAQVVKMIVKMLGIEPQHDAPFTDISIHAEETQQQIAAAYEAGIIKNINGEFRPNQYVTRAQLALMLTRAYTFVKNDFMVQRLPTFTDIEQYDEEAQRAIQVMHQRLIVTGWQGKFMPAQYAKRSHAAKMIVNTFDHLLN